MQTYCDVILLIPQLSPRSTKQLVTDIGTVTGKRASFPPPVLLLRVCVCLVSYEFALHRVSEQRYGRPGPAAVSHAAAHRHAAESQTRRLPTDGQAPAPPPNFHPSSAPLHRLLTAAGTWKDSCCKRATGTNGCLTCSCHLIQLLL